MTNIIVLDFKNRIRLNIEDLIRPPIETDWYQEIKRKLCARFENDLPAHFRERMQCVQDQPYMDGCTSNLKYVKKDAIWNAPMPVPCKVRPDQNILGDGVHEPFPWMDNKYRTAWNHLIERQGKELTIYTRSDLIAQDDYMGQIDKEHHYIVMLFFKGSSEKQRVMEPGAPSNKSRQEAYTKLKKAGFKVKRVH